MSESDPKPTTPADDWMTSRRTFLRAAGFTFASAMITGCQSSPIHHAIPYLVQPEDGELVGSEYVEPCGNFRLVFLF